MAINVKENIRYFDLSNETYLSVQRFPQQRNLKEICVVRIFAKSVD